MISTTPRRGQPRREEILLTANMHHAFIRRVSGTNWIQCAEFGDTSRANLRKLCQHPDVNSYIQEAIESNLGESHCKFTDAAAALAERLIHLGLPHDVRPYTSIQAISECFKILQQGIIDKNNREEINKIRIDLEQLERNGQTNIIEI